VLRVEITDAFAQRGREFRGVAMNETMTRLTLRNQSRLWPRRFRRGEWIGHLFIKPTKLVLFAFEVGGNGKLEAFLKQ